MLGWMYYNSLMSVVLYLRQYGKLFLFLLMLGFGIYSTYLYLTIGQRGYDIDLVVLAYQFLHWNLDLPVINLPVRDIANYHNNFYIYFGPLSSILLMPFVLVFGQSFPQVSIGIFSLITSFIATYSIAKKFKFDRVDSLWLSVFIVFSTVLFSTSVINGSAYEVQALGFAFILLSLWAYFSKKHPLLIGLFISMAFLSRFTLLLSLMFFGMEFLQKRFSFRSLVLLMIPVILALGAFGVYNNRRFHSVFETGYGYNISTHDLPIGVNLKYGKEISIVHLPANLYAFLFMPPDPVLVDVYGGMVLKFPYMKANPWGVAIWITSPLFLLLLAWKKGKYTLSAAITTLLLTLPVFLWYSIGYAQFGYRYALDFMPFLIILLLTCLDGKLSKTAIGLIILGVLFNCLYSGSIWGVYPHFGMM